MAEQSNIPYLTTAQMREVDRLMIEEYGIALLQMMENAGRNLAHLARERFLDGGPVGRSVTVLAGSGGNGGGAMVAARRLHTWGAHVQVILTRPPEVLQGVPAKQAAILQQLKLALIQADALPERKPVDLILDGVIGYSLSGAPHGAAAALIRWANAQTAPILALDVPSGLDASTGEVHDPAIRAEATLTLALPKEGLFAPGARDYVGELYLADISVPPDLYAHLGLDVGPLFAQEEILHLT
ncbi:MAG: NAD(P)H-hydrate epimerase [Anaerolineae bacterium]